MARRSFRRVTIGSAAFLATLLVGLAPLAAHAAPSGAATHLRASISTHARARPTVQPGAVWIWGSVGDFSSDMPMQLPGVSHVVAAAAGDVGLIVLKDDGTVWSLAPDGRGVSATQVPGLDDVTSIDAGSSHYLALESDGTVVAWGDDSYGQLGDGTLTDNDSPVQVAGVSHVVAIAAYLNHSVAVERDGSVWAWGDDTNDELGVQIGRLCGEALCSPIPLGVPRIHDAVAVAASDTLSMALDRNGMAWQWGYDGLDSPDDTTGVHRVPGLSHVTALAGGYLHSLALEQDGTVWAWGVGSDGELGNDAYEDSVGPVQVYGLAPVTAIAAGEWFSAALTADGSVWTWGIDPRQYVSDAFSGDTSAVPVRVPGFTDIGSIVSAETGLVAIGAVTATAPLTLTGVGASAVDALLAGPWASGAATTASPAVTLTYTRTPGLGGVTQWLAGDTDFAASDLPLTAAQDRLAVNRCGGAVAHLPVAVGGVALTYHLPGVGPRLYLPPDVLTDILLGHIREWRDVRLQRANPGIALPALPIRLVYRGDAAASTDTLTRYLTALSPQWKAQVGVGPQVRWPEGQGESGSLAVLAAVLRTPGALGYVNLGDALAQHVPLVALRDHAGQVVTPSIATVERAASSLAGALPRDLQQRLIDAPGAGAYPLAGYSFLDLCNARQDARTTALRALARYVVTTGQALLPGYHLAPVPVVVQRRALALLAATQP